MRMKNLVLSLVLALALVMSISVPVLALTSQDVTVTATPVYITLANSPNTWTVGNTDAKIAPDTIYYSNPEGGTTPPSATVEDAECHFTADTTDSSVATDLTLTWGAFTGGGADMTNSDSDGSNGESTYGAFGYYSGMTFANKVVVKSTGSAALKTSHAVGSIKWGVQIETKTGAWTSAVASTSTLTITATES